MKPLLPGQVYEHLRNMIITGKLLPGDRLNFTRLATELDVSTTPLREAMVRLAGEGLVVLVPRAGALVWKPDRNELEHLYGVQEAIEAHAAGRAAAMISAAEAQQLAALLEMMEARLIKLNAAGADILSGAELAEFLRFDSAFHMAIIKASGNPALALIASNYLVLLQIFGRGTKQRSTDGLREMCHAHRNILQALQDRDGIRARKLMIHHLGCESELALMQDEILSIRHSWTARLANTARQPV